MKALIIDEPWITEVLTGRKTWEMRKTACRLRGRIALIRKGSGQVVGTAEVIDTLPPLDTPEAYAAAEDRHRIPPHRQATAFADGWRHPWVLRNARPLATPVPYEHPQGAVIWVTLAPAVSAKVEAGCVGDAASQTDLGSAIEAPSQAPRTPAPSRAEAAATMAGQGARAKISGRIEGNRCIIPISSGNITNNHFYLRTVLPFFPEECIGGSDKSQLARQMMKVTFANGPAVITDIAGPDIHAREGRSAHYFFRNARGQIKDFFARSGAEPGDEVLIERSDPYAYSVNLRKAPRCP
ncbi:ASCH domain-containing protein [Methylocystis sp. ATCC 49242]|uniref:ASCH domain-containing protein n=1 Tax=Methylocystis sp. ATCC 49242 TaxID=622637 RepID=UPI0001F8881F|nr:ASCH domain-containing protein [Methylocystis sp. ATCC 49242]